MKPARFIVELDIPDGCTWQDMADLIRGEVQAMPGHFPPEDPITDLDRQSVRVRRYRRTASARHTETQDEAAILPIS